MFNLKKIYPVVNHLKSISGVYNDSGGEVCVFCPFCDDATRRVNPSHGHMYLSIDSPVYYCHRCNSSGTLIKFLLVTGFDDEDVIKYISSFIFHGTIRDIHLWSTTTIDYSKHNIRKMILKKDDLFRREYPDQYHQFREYIYNRLGSINYNYFLIYPENIEFGKQQTYTKLCCSFSNYDGQLVTSRIVNTTNKFRYKDVKDAIYFFQRRDFEKYQRIVLTEGTFDVINLYLYNNIFDKDNTMFISVNGKKYINTIERLIFEELLIGEFEINLIFDDDVHNHKSYLFRANMLARQYNPNIIIRGWKPLISGDVGEFPAIIEVS